jgi:hypothetical protein
MVIHTVDPHLPLEHHQAQALQGRIAHLVEAVVLLTVHLQGLHLVVEVTVVVQAGLVVVLLLVEVAQEVVVALQEGQGNIKKHIDPVLS